MYRSFLTAALCAAALFSSAQQYVHQVMVLNEGYFDVTTQTQVVPVSLGSFDPATGLYHTVATIDNARFGNHVVVEGDRVYVAADHRLLAYDANSFALLNEADVPGIRRFAVWNGHLVITLGEVGGLDHYCEVRDKNTLALVHAIDNSVLPYSCEGVTVVGDKAYIAVNNGFDWGNAVGKVGVLDMAAQTWETTIDLGPDGMNPEVVFADEDAIYAFNNKDFTGSSISKVQLNDNALSYTHNVATSSGCGSSAKVENRIYFMEYAQNVLNRFDLTSSTVLDTLMDSPATYGLIDDPINHVMYGTTTDFFSTGELHVMDYAGQVISTVAVGVSPGRLALDVRSTTGINTQEKSGHLMAFPSPATDLLTLTCTDLIPGSQVQLLDGAGRLVRSVNCTAAGQVHLDIRSLESGMYAARTATGSVIRFTKN